MPSSRALRDQIHKTLSDLGRAVHPRELAARLEVADDDQEDFFEELGRLTEEGLLKTMPGGRVKLGEKRLEPQSKGKGKAQGEPPKSSGESWDGVLSVHPRGFGFVTAVGRDDVFVPPEAIYEALHGDAVTIRVTGRSPRGAEGRVEGIVKRRSPRVAGVIKRRKKSCWLEPDDSRLRGPITIVEGEELAKDGEAAVVEITRFPLFEKELCEAKIVQVLGPQGDPQTEVQKILVREQVSEQHTPATLQNAEEMAALLRTISLEGRRDLRRVPLPTIDPTDARDHDDAVWVERNRKGYTAWVAIADVSEFVREDSALDEEARARGCTIYLPDRAIPMLPSTLAANLCSLLPEVDRYCLCVIAELDSQGRVESYELVEGVMRSAARLSYDGVARTLGFDPESPLSPAAEAMKKDLVVLAELAFKLRKNRMDRGALDLDLPEARVHLDEGTGAPTAVTKRATRPGLKKAYSMIEEMMLLANELVAQWLTKKKAPAIYRVHGKPDAIKLEKLAAIGAKLDVPVDIDSLLEPLGVAAFLRDIQGHERHHVLQMLLLRSLKQAQYAIDNEGHFGLASDCYLHFTSPIRRYPDLCVHRQIKRILRGGAIDRSEAAVEILRASATESSTRERAAMEIEREVVDLYRALYMQRHIGDQFEGRVTALTGSGIFIQLDDPFVDVMMKFESMGPDRYEMSEDELSMVGSRSGDTITLGDTIAFEIEDVAVLRRTVYARRFLTEDELARIQKGAAAQPGRIPGRGAPRGEISRKAGIGRRENAGRTSASGTKTAARPAVGGSARAGAASSGRPASARSAARTEGASDSRSAGDRAQGARDRRNARVGGNESASPPSFKPSAGSSRSGPTKKASRPLLKTGLVKKPGETRGAKKSTGKKKSYKK